ncbi:hypothetical protein Gohar_027162 [Gossypium harknessii]|uniref:Uncharacterized protein n=1 Tax=Gossypium harknessii TaxID=34285 RepID=A0A7J9HVC0_9ROSI|nr:hypothetical protein [Gossypium harknessii]
MAFEILQIKPQVEYDMYQTSGATRVRVTSEDKKAQTMKALRSLTIAIAIPLSLTLFIIFKFGSPKRYRTIMAKPIWFPPLWLINLASIGSSFSMSLAAWFVWVNRGFHMNSDALPLYISQISLSIVWHPLQLINDSVWFGFLLFASLDESVSIALSLSPPLLNFVSTVGAMSLNKTSSINEDIGAFRLEILQTAKVTKLDKASWSYANEPLALSVLAHNLSTTFNFPKLSYNKVSDPEEYLTHYYNYMNILVASNEIKCRAFSMTFSGTARHWYLLLSQGSINSFNELVGLFMSRKDLM